MKFSYPTATEEEIAKLKKLVPRIERKIAVEEKKVEASQPAPAPAEEKKQSFGESRRYYKGLFEGGIANVIPSIEPLKIDNPAFLLSILMPEVKLYRWQFEQLMQIAGYLTVGDYKNKTEISDTNPFKLVLPAANGSGKDMIIIAATAVWFALVGLRNRIIITSSSFDQIKFQTEVHIKKLVDIANKKFGKLIHYTQFHYIVPELGSEIKLFATDEAGRAEGYHPYHGGKMMLIMNEAKSVKEDIFDALSRCTGYSHWLEISSPGPRRGHMYRAAGNAISYPNPVTLGRFYMRRVTAFDCPHISKSHIQEMAYEKGEESPWYRSSILAEFSDFDEPVVITDFAYEKALKNPTSHQGRDIGIGLDIAAGGDETAMVVRQGNKVIYFYAFRQEDTELAANTIDASLSSWKDGEYTFRADDGGIGHAVIDKLKYKGWVILRTNNQSPAYKKSEFLNLGAEMYFYVKRLIERNEIILPDNINRLREQLTTRRYKGEESTQGKLALQSKAEARADGLVSPDRADAFVLCFSTYRPNSVAPKTPEGPKRYTIEELFQLERQGKLFIKDIPMAKGRFTYQTTKV